MTKPPSQRVWLRARALLEVMVSLTMRRAIKPYRDDVELAMKAPMSVSKPADHRKGVPNGASKANDNMRLGT